MINVPKRRSHGCDVCYKNKPTECFLGFNRNILWVCGKCYDMITRKVVKRHKLSLSFYGNKSVEGEK